MRNVRILLFIAFSVFLVSSLMITAKADEPRQDVLYYCNCGPECNCNSVSTHPGNCKKKAEHKKSLPFSIPIIDNILNMPIRCSKWKTGRRFPICR